MSPPRPHAPQKGRPKSRTGLALSLALLGAVSISGCKSRTSGSGAARDDLTLAPREADAVVMANLSQARKNPSWQRGLQKLSDEAKGRSDYQDFVRRCKIDPFTQIDSLFVALPGSVPGTPPGTSGERKEYVAFLRGSFAPEQLAACIRDISRDKGDPITESEHQGVRLIGIGRQPTFLAPLGKKALAVGSQEWIKQVAALHAGKAQAGQSLGDRKELQTLISRTRTGDTLWWAALVPPSSTERLRNDPQLGPVRSLQSISGSIDLAKGLLAHAYLDLANADDASALRQKADAQLKEIRGTPALRILGVAGYLDGVKTGAKDRTFQIDVELSQEQLDDLLNRLSGLSGLLVGRPPGAAPTQPPVGVPAKDVPKD